MPTSERHPPFNWRSSGEVVIEVINCLSFAVFVATSVALLGVIVHRGELPDQSSLRWAIPVCLIASAMAWFVQVGYALDLFDSTENGATKIRSDDGKLLASHEKVFLACAPSVRRVSGLEGVLFKTYRRSNEPFFEPTRPSISNDRPVASWNALPTST
jgi:hypothetical protein